MLLLYKFQRIASLKRKKKLILYEGIKLHHRRKMDGTEYPVQ
jgi:hypothetical protein